MSVSRSLASLDAHDDLIMAVLNHAQGTLGYAPSDGTQCLSILFSPLGELPLGGTQSMTKSSATDEDCFETHERHGRFLLAEREQVRALPVGPGSKVAVVGFGGLGHLAVKIAVALGASTTVISRSPDKREDALAFGAQGFIASTDAEQMSAARDSFDVIIDTVSANHGRASYLRFVTVDGTLSVLDYLGLLNLKAIDLLLGHKKLSSAGSGGRPAAAEMLQFCAQHGIAADVEVLPSFQMDAVIGRLRWNDARYRFVLALSDLG